MKNLLEGLFLHDIILMCLGILLFLVLVIAMIVYIFRKEAVGKLLTFFFIPIVMIGYPSIQKISFSHEMIELEKKKEQVAQNPGDSTAVKELEESLSKVKDRPIESPESLTAIGEAYALLGDNRKAQVLSEAALAKDPDLQKAREVKNIAALRENLQKITSDNTDPQVIAAVQDNLHTLEQLPTESIIRTRTLSKAYEKLGDTAKARTYDEATRRIRADNIRSRQQQND